MFNEHADFCTQISLIYCFTIVENVNQKIDSIYTNELYRYTVGIIDTRIDVSNRSQCMFHYYG